MERWLTGASSQQAVSDSISRLTPQRRPRRLNIRFDLRLERA
jgi:hypothetical protein